MWKKFKEMPITYPVVIMLLICLVITAALAGTNALTVDKIAAINKDNEIKAMKKIIKADEYKEETVKDGEDKYTVALKDGETEGYIFKVSEKGYGGAVTVMVAIDPEGVINSVKILDVSNETPGLGQNTQKDSFTKQFNGKSGELKAVKNGTASAENEIDAVASATISSTAVTKAVNKALELYETVAVPENDTVSGATTDPYGNVVTKN